MDEHPAKALLPILIKEVGKVLLPILVNAAQFINALLPILVRDVGKVANVFIDEQELNVLSLI